MPALHSIAVYRLLDISHIIVHIKLEVMRVSVTSVKHDSVAH